MKLIYKIIIAAIAFTVFCSAGFNKPDKIQRRKGIMNVDSKGKITFQPLEDWADFTPKSDTLYQYRVN